MNIINAIIFTSQIECSSHEKRVERHRPSFGQSQTLFVQPISQQSYRYLSRYLLPGFDAHIIKNILEGKKECGSDDTLRYLWCNA